MIKIDRNILEQFIYLKSKKDSDFEIEMYIRAEMAIVNKASRKSIAAAERV
jgi:hypothetical protein